MNLSTQNKPAVQILQTSVGVVIEATVDPVTLQLDCTWSPPPPYSRKKLKRIWREYIPWRDALLDAAARKAGIRVLMCTHGVNGQLTLTAYGVAPEETL